MRQFFLIFEQNRCEKSSWGSTLCV